MLKRIIGYTFMFYLLLALILSLAGVTSIDLMNSSNRFFSTVTNQFRSWDLFQFGSIEKIPKNDASGIAGIINVLIFIANLFVVLANFLSTIANMIIQLFAFLGAIFYVIFNATTIFTNTLVPTVIA